MDMTGIGEWVDYECTKCGTWFPVDARRCPSCGTESIWKKDRDELIDEIVDELMEEIDDDVPGLEGMEEQRSAKPLQEDIGDASGKKADGGGFLRRKLRSIFM
jgi:RNA polymerase subunit RPABC4/transcription elongation factor Spt4